MTNEDDRTTPLGLFNYAQTYWRSAVTLQAAKVRVTHPDDPVYFLYFHAIELYLKAYLRLHGLSVAELRSKKYGHSIENLTNKATRDGLIFNSLDRQVLSLMERMDITDVRYIKTGPFTRPRLEALDDTCKSLHFKVAASLSEHDIPVRHYIE